MATDKPPMADKQFLEELKDEIEGYDQAMEVERGYGESLASRVAKDKMPNVYYEVMRRLELLGAA